MDLLRYFLPAALCLPLFLQLSLGRPHLFVQFCFQPLRRVKLHADRLLIVHDLADLTVQLFCLAADIFQCAFCRRHSYLGLIQVHFRRILHNIGFLQLFFDLFDLLVMPGPLFPKAVGLRLHLVHLAL